jgi:hypothetical protein
LNDKPINVSAQHDLQQHAFHKAWVVPPRSAFLLTGRLHPLVAAGVKQGLGMLSRYLYVVTDNTAPDGAARSQLQVLDVKNKLVAGQCGSRQACG